jgi:hypothetical protein
MKISHLFIKYHNFAYCLIFSNLPTLTSGALYLYFHLYFYCYTNNIYKKDVSELLQDPCNLTGPICSLIFF